jgi:hypothetical protein
LTAGTYEIIAARTVLTATTKGDAIDYFVTATHGVVFADTVTALSGRTINATFRSKLGLVEFNQ